MSDERTVIFDGCGRGSVPKCCQGRVKQVTTYEARAYRNMIDAPRLVASYFACDDCNQVLMFQREEEKVWETKNKRGSKKR